MSENFISDAMFWCSLALIIVTVTYTVINALMLYESQKQRKLKTSPNVIAYLKSTEDYKAIRLYIKNVGEGVALDVKVDVIQDYCRFGKENCKLSETGLFKYGLDILPPGEHCSYYLDAWTNIKEKDLENLCVELEISCAGADREPHSHSCKLQFIQIFGQGYANPPETYIGKIAHCMNEISRTLAKIN